MYRVTLISWMVIICASHLATAADIHLKPKCECRGPVVRLGDVATIRSRDRREIALLSRLELFDAPTGRQVRTITHYEIRDILENHGFDFRRFRLSGANRVQLIRVDGTADTRLQSPPRRRVPNRKWPVSQGKTPGEDQRTIRVVHTTRPLRRGDIIRDADVQQRVVIGKPSTADVYGDVSDVIGLEVTQSLSSGEPIRATAIQSPILVRRGEVVTVYARAAGVQVKTEGRAVQQGSYGDLITIESIADRTQRQKFAARVVDVQEVEVYAQGVAAR